jgi:Ca2+-binding RTX toxin-like protein
MQPINYDGMNSYAVLATANAYSASSSHNDTVDVQGIAPDLWTIIAAGSGDTVNVGNPSHTLAAVQGDLRIQGSNPTVNFDDTWDRNPGTITMASDGVYGYLVTGLLPASSVNRGRVWLQLASAAPVSINTGTAADTFLVQDLVEAPALTLKGGSGNNTLQGPNRTNTWQISGANSGTLDGAVKFVSVQNLTGGAGNDTFQFQGGGSLAGKIDGGGGTNALDYYAYQGDILVDLLLNSASLVGGGVFNMANVVGSQGNSLVVGDASTTSLVGGTGRNILIGGGGTETITGGGGFNLLIGGKTAYDTNLIALQDLMQYWDNPAVTSLSQLVNPLLRRTGVMVNGLTLMLNKNTVQDDNAVDTLVAGGGATWFINDKEDIIQGFRDSIDRKTPV